MRTPGGLSLTGGMIANSSGSSAITLSRAVAATAAAAASAAGTLFSYKLSVGLGAGGIAEDGIPRMGCTRGAHDGMARMAWRGWHGEDGMARMAWR